MKKRCLAMLLALILCLNLTEPAAYAAEIPAADSAAEVTHSYPASSAETPAAAGKSDGSETFISEESTSPYTSAGLTDSAILCELPALREASAKHFALADGRRASVLYGITVHEQTASGEWLPINNELKYDAEDPDGASFHAEGELLRVAFYEEPTAGKLLSLELKGTEGKISWGPELSAKDGETPAQECAVSYTPQEPWEDHSFLDIRALSGVLRYENIFPDISLEYQLQGHDVKENLLIASRSAAEALAAEGFSFLLTLEGGLTAAYDKETRSVLIRDSASEVLYSLQAPYMEDDKGEVSGELACELAELSTPAAPEGTDAVSYRFTLSPDAEWLLAEERAFPVLIDPSLRNTLNNSSIDTATVYSSGPNGNGMYLYGDIYAGYQNANYKKLRCAAKLTLPALTESDTVVSAVLEFTQSGYSSWDYSYPVTINAHRITSNLSFPSMTWNTLNGNYDDRVLDSQTMNYSRLGDMHAWDLTGTVRDWYRNGENYGIALVSTCEEDSVYRYATLYSAKRVGLSTSLLPRATIVYLNQEGLSDDLTYHSAGTAGTGVLSICDFTGGLSYVFTDISMSGAHLPVTIQHIHNNDRRAEDQLIPGMRFGKGFRLNLNQSIQSSSVSGYPYSYTDADGTELYFVLKSGTAGANGSTYYQETEPTRILTKTSSGFTLDLGDSIVYSFNKALGGAYYLSSIHNGKNNKTQTLGYDAGNRLTSVTDGGGRVTTLTYNSSGYLTRITDPDSRVTAYDYDTEGHLVSIERWYAATYSAANAERTTIEYGSESEGIIDGIKTVADAYGRHLTVFCGGRTSQAFFVTEYSSDGTGGGTLNFTYSAGETTVTDAEGHSETLLFDDYGHTVAIRDGEGNGIFGNYGTGNAETRNKLTVESKLQSSVANYLTNSGAEGSSVSPWTLEQNGGNGSLSQTTAEKYGGSKAYSLTSSSTSGELESYQIANISGGRGKSITFSGYLKTGSLNIGNEPEAGLYLALDVINQDGIWERSYSPVITEASYASDWTRVAVTATIPEDTVSEQVKASLLFSYASGTVYADELQLEMGGAANRCNLLENGHLAGTVGSGTASGWTGNQLNANTDKLTAGRRYHAQNNAADTGFTVTGDVSKAKYLTQTVQQSGSAGDCYVFTAWAKADAIPQTDGGYNPIYSRNRPFGVLLRFIKADGGAEEKSFSFDAKTENWQLLSGEAVAPCAYVRLELRLLYSYQTGTACFDDVGLYRDGFGETMTYDSKGRLSYVKDSAGRTVCYHYASPDRNELSAISYPDETNVWYYYDSSWRLIREDDSSGHITYYSYDADGNLQNTNMSNDGLTLSSGYSSFDRNGYLTEQVPTVGSTVTYSYNNRGTLLSMADSVSTLYYDHDDKDRLTQVRGPARVQYSYTGDQLSQITHYTSGQTSGPVTYRLNHDGLGNVTDISVGHNLLVSYTYDEYSDKLLETYYGNGFSVTPAYDSLERVISQSSEGIPYVRWAYGADGRIGTETDCANDVQTRYAYNKDGSLASVTRDNGTRFTYGYDFTKGKLTEEKIRVGSEERTVSYDYYGLNAGYDSSLLKKIVLPQVNVNGSNVTPELRYSYDIIGRSYPVLTLGSTELIDVSCTYCNLGGELTTTIPESMRIETPEGVETLLYDYDDRNNITKIRRQTAQGTTLLVSYTYDELNQLIREDNAELDLTYIYKYDFGGNITRARQYAYTTESVEGISSVTWDLYEYYGAWGDVLDWFCNIEITYDSIGNPLDYVRDLSFSWDRGRLLSSVYSRADGGPIANYTYDPSGIRTSKTVYVNGSAETTYYTLDGDRVIREESGSDTIWYYYDAAGALIGFELNGEPYYYIKNVQGDIIRIIDKTGYTVVSYTYDAWGNLRATSGSLASTVGVKNPYRYRGYRYDAETGLYYLQSRYYDPALRRFINADSQISAGNDLTGTNLYTYCRNNPSNMVDKSGTDATTIASEWASSMWWLCGVDGPIPAGDIVYALGVVGFALYAICSTTEKTECVEETIDKQNKKHPDKYTVYALVDSQNDVKYVGRTKNLEQRLKQHKHSVKTGGLTLGFYYSDLTWSEARGLEELGIITYNLIECGRNSIRGISGKNPNRNAYLSALWNYFYNKGSDLYYNIIGR